jgi:hypothetical protein
MHLVEESGSYGTLDYVGQARDTKQEIQQGWCSINKGWDTAYAISDIRTHQTRQCAGIGRCWCGTGSICVECVAQHGGGQCARKHQHSWPSCET